MQGSAAVRTELADEKASVEPAVSVSKNEEAGDRMVREAENVALTGSTVTVQYEDNMVPVCDSSAPDTAHDIQIHVQRPSPVRQVSGSHRQLFSVGTGHVSKDDEQNERLDSTPPVRNAAAEHSTLSQDFSTISVKKDELGASSLENISANMATKAEEADMQRVRPISGPATVTCAEPPEFDLVRKSRSVTNSLDEDGENADFVIRSRRSVGAICSVMQDGSVRPFASGMGYSAPKDSIRRICSTVSFDRQSLKSLGSSFDIDDPADLSSHGASAQPGAQRTNVYGLRSRHTSGWETPMSTLDTSSVTSMGEAGSQLKICSAD